MYNKAQKRLYPVSEIDEDSDESIHEKLEVQVLKEITHLEEFVSNKEIEVQRADSLMSNYQRVGSELLGKPETTTFEID